MGDDRGRLRSSSLVDAVAFFSTGLGDSHSHDAEVICFLTGGNEDLIGKCLNIDTARYFDDAAKRLAPDAENIVILANPVLPHDEGEIVLQSADPNVHPSIRANYYDDPYDMKVMLAVVRRTLDIAAHWPGNRSRPAVIPAVPGGRRRGYVTGARAVTRCWRTSPCISRSLCTTIPAHAGSATSSIRGCACSASAGVPRRGCQRHAQHHQRQHQCAIHHDRRKGGGNDRGR